MNQEPLNWAYVAGIIDGEGCIALHKRTAKTYAAGFQVVPHLSITNTNQQLIVDIHQFVEAGKITTYKHAKPNWKQPFMLQAYGQDIKRILDGALPFLRVKREQALCVLDFVNKYSHYGLRLTAPDREDQLGLLIRVKARNKKGV